MLVDCIVEQNIYEIVQASRIHITVSSFWGKRWVWESGMKGKIWSNFMQLWEWLDNRN